MSTLDTLFSLDPERDVREWLEQFVSYRIVERASTRVRMCGWIWDIEQTPTWTLNRWSAQGLVASGLSFLRFGVGGCVGFHGHVPSSASARR
ncbi:MAG: hypothetical protein ACLQVI_12775, partial [Polyangiaceae bacterium]